jgi:carnitine O-acetyltransferase
VIVFDNGRSGANLEHSAMDGTPTSRLNDWIIRSLAANKIPLGSPTAQSLSALPSVSPIEFQLPGTAVAAISNAVATHTAEMATNQLAVLQYDGYGKDAIKKFKLSPDSYTQLVMQLAYYKMKGEVAPTYESGQTRKYALGRTEVIRSATVESLAWCKAMETPGTTVSLSSYMEELELTTEI